MKPSGLKICKNNITVVNKETKYLNPDQLKRLHKRHFQGALVRCGASLFMWGFAVIAFLVGSIQANHLINISFSVLFLIVINPPVLWILRYISRKRQYEYMSMMMNFLEIIGYTAIIYFLGGINALFLSPIYAAVITYVGAIGPNSFPFRIAGMCSVTLSIMVALEYYGFIPHQDPFWRQALPGSSQLIHLSATICMLNVVAFMASYTGSLLKRNKIRLRDQNIELERSRTKLKKLPPDWRNKILSSK